MYRYSNVTVTESGALTPSISGTTSVCFGGTTTLTANGGATYVWSNGPITATNTVGAGSYVVTATDASGCTGTASVTVTESGALTPSISGTTSVCFGGTTTLTANGGATYVWSNGPITATNTVGAGSYVVTATDASGCTGTASVTVTESGALTPSISGTTSVCFGGTTTLTANGGATYVWSNGPITATNTVGAGTYVVTATDASGCTGTASVTVIESGALTPSISGTTSVCFGGTTTLTANGGATYVWSNGPITATNTVGAGSYVVTATDASGCTGTANVTVIESGALTPSISGTTSVCFGGTTTLTANGGATYVWSNGPITATNTVGAGSYVVTATDASGCTGTASVTVIESGALTPSISGTTSVCFGGTTTLTANGGATYVWSNGPITATNTVGAGSYVVTATDASGCTGTANVTVIESGALTPSISGTTSVCFGGTTTLTANGGATYVWSNGPITATNTVGAGSYVVTATDASGCTGTASVTVTESGVLTPSISGTTSVCFGGTTTLTANGGATYVWSNGPITATNTVGAGSYVVTATDASGCTGTASVNVTESGALTPTITGDNTICFGGTTTLTANGGLTYQWESGPSTAAYTVGSGTYVVTATDASGCTGTASVTVTESGELTPTITGDNTICFGGTTTLTANGGATYQWESGPSTATYTVGSGTYVVTATDASGCTGTASVTVTESGELTPTITGDNTICFGGTTTLTANGGSTYQWESGPSTATYTVGSGTYVVTATDASGCTGTASVTVTESGELTPTITGDNTVCFGGTTILTANGGATYQWESGPSTATYTVGSGTYVVTATDASGCTGTASVTVTESGELTPTITGDNTICFGGTTTLTANGGSTYQWESGPSTATYTVGSGTYVVTATDASGCTGTASVTVTESGELTPTITGDNTVCFGGTTILTANGGATYQWESGPSTSTYTVGVGTYVVTATDASGCTGTASVTVAEFLNFTPFITGDNEICVGENTIFTANGGSTYLWNTLETNASITVDVALEYIVTVTDINGCTATASRTLTVTPLPNAGADVSVTCYETGVAVMSASGLGTWTLGTSAGTAVITNPNSATTTITNFSINGTYELIWTVGDCIDNVLINVGDDCACPIINNIINTPTPASYCESATSITINGEEASPIDGVYEWSYSFNGSPFAVATGTNDQRDYTATILGIGEHRFQRKYTTTSGIICDDLSNIVTINVYPNPIAIITGDSEICAGESTVFTANGGSTYLWNTLETSASIIVDVALEYIVTVTDVNGCTATASRTLTVNPLPIASITGDNEICAGENTIFTANGGVTYLWDTNETSSFITVSVAREYIVTVTDANGCTATASRTLTVNPLPIASITGDNEICAGENIIFTANGGAPYLWNTTETSASITVDVALEYIVTVTDIT